MFSDVERLSRPFADRTNRSHNIGFRQRPASILAATDFGGVLMVETNQQHLSISAARSDPDRNILSVFPDAYVGTCELALFGSCDGRIDLVPMRTNQANRSVNNHFGSIGPVTKPMAVPVLSRCRSFERERISPTKTVPVGHMKRQGQDIRSVLGHLIKESVRRRARRATLRCEELHDDRTFRRRRHDGQKAKGETSQNRNAQRHSGSSKGTVFDCPSSAGSVRYRSCQHELVSSAASCSAA